MPLRSAIVYASHIGHTGKTTLSFQTSCSYAKRHPEVTVLVMDLAEEGDLTKRFLGGVDASQTKDPSLYGGVFNLLDAAKQSPGLLKRLVGSGSLDVAKHAIKVADHNKCIPSNVLLITSGAYPCEDKPMDKETRMNICDRIRTALETSNVTWKLFCDTDGDRRPSPFTLLGYGLCSQAIVPLHLNKGDLDRTETMLGMLNEARASGETKAQVLMIVWNFVKSNKDDRSVHNGAVLPFTPTKVNLDILDSCNRRVYALSQELDQLFIHSEASEADFAKNSTCVLRQLADNMLRPSEELGLPFVEIIDRFNAGGKKSMKFQSGAVEYEAKDSVIQGVHDAMRHIEEKLESLSL